MRKRAVWACGGVVLAALLLFAALHLVPEFGNAVDRRVNAAEYASKAYVLAGEYQDTFHVLEQRQRAYPEKAHRYFVYTKEGVPLFETEKTAPLGDLQGVYRLDGVTCYRWEDHVVHHRELPSRWGAVELVKMVHLEPAEHQFLTPCARQILKEDWAGFRGAAPFLVQARAQESIDLLKRLAAGEMAAVPESLKGQELEEIQEYSRVMLGKFLD